MLVCVLWVVAIMTVIALGFGRRSLIEGTAARYSLDMSKAMYMARGAVNRGIVELDNKAFYDALRGGESVTSYTQPWAKPTDLLEAGGDAPEFFAGGEEEEFEDDICAYVIEDESARVSLVAAEDELLDAVPGMTRGIMRQINYRRRGNAADNVDRQPFITLEEIRFLDGVSDDDWFGDKNRPGLRDTLTCWSGPQVNINTASEDVLKCVPQLGGAARTIIDYRKGPDGELFTEDDQEFQNSADAMSKLRLSGRAQEAFNKYCTFTSRFFRITGTATRRQGKIRATCTAIVELQGGRAIVKMWREGQLEP